LPLFLVVIDFNTVNYMSQLPSPFEFAISSEARLIFRAMHDKRGLSDNDVMDKLLDWFSQLEEDQQKALLASKAARGSEELLHVKRVYELLGQFTDEPTPVPQPNDAEEKP